MMPSGWNNMDTKMKYQALVMQAWAYNKNHSTDENKQDTD